MTALDHLVVAARTLQDGVAWCEATLGIVPEPGGEHALMGTHNRVFNVSSARFPRAYVEIIAINPNAPAPGRRRWFDLDEPAMQQAIARGPALIHWVARCDDIHASVHAMARAGMDRGDVVQAERRTPAGLLRWQISVRADGQRLLGGALPTLIQWGEVHPADTMPPSGVTLTHVAVRGLPPALAAWMPVKVELATDASAASLCVSLATPRGKVVLPSPNTGADLVQP